MEMSCYPWPKNQKLLTVQEDERLAQLVNIYGPKKWSQIASELGTKGSKQVGRVFGLRALF